ncbi:hypothetical protein ACP43V_16060 [Vibrio genomosp. F10 str. 9ZC157]|uniref:hypothetical protein n=1 Tax=Vibrio genomosp. F10 TaxID=723171 RepID=UPI0003069B57|nr:hypothetical protein [Vibrio genomosp. F10]OEE93470.1 hypothetical protein A1QM_09300 [Vibrio genomosp. F10 str. 9ZC157]
MSIEKFTAFMNKVSQKSQEVSSHLDKLTYVRNKTSPVRLEIAKLEANLDLVCSQIRLSKTQEKVSIEKIQQLKGLGINFEPTILPDLDVLNEEKSLIEEKLKLKQTQLEELNKSAEKDWEGN